MNLRVKQYKILITIKQYAALLTGAAILSFGLYNIHSRSQITEGGVLGMTLLHHHWFSISPGIAGPLMDLVCYAAGFKLLGKAFLKQAVAASLAFSFFYSINERIGYLMPDLSDYPLTAALLGGAFVGAGVGLIVRAGGASGGDDALALIITKLSPLTLSKAYFITDFIVLALSLTYIPLTKILCSLITVTVSSFLIGKIYAYGSCETI